MMERYELTDEEKISCMQERYLSWYLTGEYSSLVDVEELIDEDVNSGLFRKSRSKVIDQMFQRVMSMVLE